MSPVTSDVRAAEAALHAAAEAATGYEDFGSRDYLTGLRVALEALCADQGLTGDALVAAAVPGPMLTALVGRLYAVEGMRRHPEYASSEVLRPMVICGVPRTGTTALHLLLAQDERFQGIESWLAQTPMVRPPREAWESHPEYRAARDRAERDRERLQALHWVAADEVDETNVLLRQAFLVNFSLRGPLPTYDRWFLAQDLTPAYRYVRDVIRLIGLSSPQSPWLLKNPGDILGLEGLLAAFPDACVICTHRDPVSAIPSVASLLVALRSGTERYGVDPGPVDRVATGRRELDLWQIALARYEAAKERHPDRFHDVWQRDLIRDPLGVVRGIYERFGLDLSATADARMRSWAEQNAQGAHGGHTYTPEEFGLSAAEIKERYADYRRSYGFE